MPLQILSLFLAILFSHVVNATECNQKCGGVNVTYPFGLDDNPGCFYKANGSDYSFKLSCNESASPATLAYGENGIRFVLNISEEMSTALVEVSVAHICYDVSGSLSEQFDVDVDLMGTPFTFSNSSNNTVTTLGCGAVGLVESPSEIEGDGFAAGCLSMCNKKDNNSVADDYLYLVKNFHNCSSKVSCCQTGIPDKLKTIYISVENINNYSCSYSFLGPENFTIRESSPEKYLYSQVALDWDIGNQKCDKANHICDKNADCINSTHGPGYQCSCKKGFEGNPYISTGNPYISTGCKNINECQKENRNKYTCHGTCKDTIGDYSCHCSFPHAGDGKVGCRLGTLAKVMIGIGSGILIAACIFPQCWMYQRRRKERNQRQNGGMFLKHLKVKEYKEAQLYKATNGYSRENILGEGGHGWVYKGSEGKTEIAVKKSKIINQDQIEQFLNEVEIVSQINHKNVVKLLGICLETKVPLLVYEFVSNGTLYHHIHKKGTSILYSWPTCLKIVAETAGALDYMHSLAHPPIIHRDIKTANILLDEKCTAKVADFGASKLIPLDQTIAPTRGQGTMGYLDPEYLQTGELTVKSDVYGFGVVLMELLCKTKPLYQGLNGERISLVQLFISAVQENHLDQLLKIGEVSERGIEQVHIVAKLAVKCVKMPSKDRPTMTEVADVLNGLNKEYQSYHFEGNSVEQVNLLGDQELLTTSVSFELE